MKKKITTLTFYAIIFQLLFSCSSKLQYEDILSLLPSDITDVEDNDSDQDNEESETEQSPIIASWNGFGGKMNDSLVFDNNYLILAKGLKGIEVVSRTNSKIISRFENTDLTIPYENITLIPNSKVILASHNTSGIELLDFSNITSPKKLSSLDTTGTALNTIVSSDGTKAFVADGSSGIHIVDISNHSSITLLGSFDTNGSATRLALSNDESTLFVADLGSGLDILNVSNPSSITRITNFATTDLAYDVVLNSANTRAYLAEDDDGVRVIDITTLPSPIPVNTYSPGYKVRHLDIGQSESYLYLGGLTHFEIIDISNELAITSSTDQSLINFSNSVIVSDDETTAYICDKSFGLRVYDITNKSSPSSLVELETIIFSQFIETTQDKSLVFISDSFNLKIIDNSDQTQPQLLTRLNQSNKTPSQVALNANEDKLYVIFQDTGLAIYDISDPSLPSLIGSDFSMNGHISATGGLVLTSDGNHLITGTLNGTAGEILIYDISDPTSPNVISNEVTPIDQYRLIMSSDEQILYQADGARGLVITDTSDLNSPSNLSSTLFAGMSEATDLIINSAETIAYIIDDNGLYFIDISTPSSPTLINNFSSFTIPFRIKFISGESKVLASDYSSIRVMNILNPLSPSIDTTFTTQSYPTDFIISTDEKTIYLSDGENGFSILELDGTTLTYKY